MGRTLTAVMLVSVLIAAGTPGFAELYKYTDENGRIHYTNSLANIPPQFRDNIITEEEIKYTAPTETPTSNNQRTNTHTQPETGNDSLDQQHNDLLSRKAALDKKRKSLDQRRQELEARGKNITSQAGRKRYNQQVTALNQAYEALHKEEMTLKKELREYNRKVEKSLTEKLESVRQHNSANEDGTRQ